MHLKGQCHEIFASGFFHELVSPQPQSVHVPLGSFQTFWKNRRDIQRCPNKIIKTFMIEDFFHLPPVSTTPVVNLELRISPRMFQKNSKRPEWYTQGIGGNWFMKKTRSRKSRDAVPWKGYTHKHEIFYFIFLQKPNLMIPRACNTRFLKIVLDFAEIFEQI